MCKGIPVVYSGVLGVLLVCDGTISFLIFFRYLKVTMLLKFFQTGFMNHSTTNGVGIVEIDIKHRVTIIPASSLRRDSIGDKTPAVTFMMFPDNKKRANLAILLLYSFPSETVLCLM